MSTRALPPAPPARFALPAAHRGVLDASARELVRARAEELLSRPTAPYAEDALVAAVRDFARRVPGLALSADRYQNLIVEWPGTSAGARDGGRANGSVLAYSAHLDHPGFLYLGRRAGLHAASFHGGVPERFFAGARVRFFDPETAAACATARVVSAARDQDHLLVAVLDDFAGRARRGMFGMWDLTPGRLRGTRLHARVCDDLLGAAALLATLELAARERLPAPLVGIFTRAEETGFIGCQGFLRAKGASPEWTVIGLECSPKRATARVGLGPVIRVGDAASIFVPAVTHLLQEVAADLRALHAGFVHQRALMDGGRCESSAYNLWGVPAGGLCLALGNYHNCAPNGSIAPEYVDWNDHESLVALMLATARRWRAGPAEGRMRAGLDRVWNVERKRLLESARRIARRAK